MCMQVKPIIKSEIKAEEPPRSSNKEAEESAGESTHCSSLMIEAFLPTDVPGALCIYSIYSTTSL